MRVWYTPLPISMRSSGRAESDSGLDIRVMNGRFELNRTGGSSLQGGRREYLHVGLTAASPCHRRPFHERPSPILRATSVMNPRHGCIIVAIRP